MSVAALPTRRILFMPQIGWRTSNKQPVASNTHTKHMQRTIHVIFDRCFRRFPHTYARVCYTMRTMDWVARCPIYYTNVVVGPGALAMILSD